jgi:hypothetical protein
MILHLVRSLGEEEVAVLSFFEEGNENSGVSEGKMLNDPSLPGAEDISNPVNEIFFSIPQILDPLNP